METPSKAALIKRLEEAFQTTVGWINEQSLAHFNEEMVTGKWTMAGHLYHLIKTTRSINQGLQMPKLAMRTVFGKNNREERSFAAMHQKYKDALQATNIKAPTNYSPAEGRQFDRAELTQRFEQALAEQIKALDKWSEKDLGTYILPHPAIGKCTLREFLYFSIFHTYHHLDILREQYVAT